MTIKGQYFPQDDLSSYGDQLGSINEINVRSSLLREVINSRQHLLSLAGNEGIQIESPSRPEFAAVSPFPESKFGGLGEGTTIRVTDRGIAVTTASGQKALLTREQLAKHIEAKKLTLEKQIKNRGTAPTQEEQIALQRMDEDTRAIRSGEQINQKLARVLATDIAAKRSARANRPSTGGTAIIVTALGTALLHYLNDRN